MPARRVLDRSRFRGPGAGRRPLSVARMNLAQHVRVTQTLHVQLSVADEPALTRIIGVPADAPSYWIVEAYQLSLGIEPEAPELDDMDDPWPLIDLTSWRARPQCISMPGIA